MKRAVVVPKKERWLHEPAMKATLADADWWMSKNPAKATDLADFGAKLGKIKSFGPFGPKYEVGQALRQ